MGHCWPATGISSYADMCRVYLYHSCAHYAISANSSSANCCSTHNWISYEFANQFYIALTGIIKETITVAHATHNDK